jgi:hypothetical protein
MEIYEYGVPVNEMPSLMPFWCSYESQPCVTFMLREEAALLLLVRML